MNNILRQGTNPAILIELENAVMSDIEEGVLTFSQGNYEIDIPFSQATVIDETHFTLPRLTQEQTLAFNLNGNVRIQAKILLKDGNIFSTSIVITSVYELINKEVFNA